MNTEISYANLQNVFQLTDYSTINKDSTKYGTAIWSNQEINQILELFGLPLDSSLSVLCVEMLPHITNIYEHVNSLNDIKVNDNLNMVIDFTNLPNEDEIKYQKNNIAVEAVVNEVKPLSNQLGEFRILRTWPLTEVPYVCCTGCGLS